MKNSIFLSICFLFSTLCTQAQSSETISADELYNSGNQAYNDNKFGEAVYNFEKALILHPKAKDLKINLELAKERLDADIIELDPFFLSEWWDGLKNTFMPGTWKFISILLLIGLIGLVYFFLFGNKELSKSKVYLGIGVITFAMLLSIFAGISRANDIFDNPYAVIFGESDALYQGPDPVSDKIKSVVSGVKVKVLDQSGVWYKVSTMDSEQGWILKQNVRLLKF